MNVKAIMIGGVVLLAGCSAEDREYFGIEPGKCMIEEYMHYEGVQEKKDLTLIQKDVIVSGFTTCLSGRISVRAY